MTLKQYKQNLDAFIATNPDCLDKQVITSSDDEGNSFHLVVYSPVKGAYDESERDFQTEDIEEVNAVCVN